MEAPYCGRAQAHPPQALPTIEGRTHAGLVKLVENTESLLDRSKALQDQIVKDVSPESANLKNVMLPFAQDDDTVSIESHIIGFYQAVSIDAKLRDASTEAEKKLDNFAIESSVREDIFNLVNAVFKKQKDEMEIAARRTWSTTGLPVRAGPTETPSLLSRYYDRRGDVGIWQERLEELEYEHREELVQRDFRLDKGQELPISDEEFEATYQTQRRQLLADLQAAKTDANHIALLCEKSGDGTPLYKFPNVDTTLKWKNSALHSRELLPLQDEIRAAEEELDKINERDAYDRPDNRDTVNERLRTRSSYNKGAAARSEMFASRYDEPVVLFEQWLMRAGDASITQERMDIRGAEQASIAEQHNIHRPRRGRGQRRNKAYWTRYKPLDVENPFRKRDILFADSEGRVRLPALADLDTGFELLEGDVMSPGYARQLGRCHEISTNFTEPELRSISGHHTPITGVLRDVPFRVSGTSSTFMRDFFVCDAITGKADIMLGAHFLKDAMHLFFEGLKFFGNMIAPWSSIKKESPAEKLEREEREILQRIEAAKLDLARVEAERLKLAAAATQRQGGGGASGQ